MILRSKRGAFPAADKYNFSGGGRPFRAFVRGKESFMKSKNPKVVPWLIVVSAYLMLLPFLAVFIALLAGAEVPDGVVAAVEIVALAVGIAAMLLCFVNLISAVLGFMQDRPAPFGTTAAVKIALIPFYAASLFIWILLGIAGIVLLNPMFLALGAVVFIIIGLSVACAYLIMLATGVHNMAYLLKKAWREKDWKALFWLVPHFIFCADVIAAILLWRREQRKAVPFGPAFSSEEEPAGQD